MKSLWINLILILALAGAWNLTTRAQSPEQTYQKGLMKEEGEGALQDAISLYSQVSDNSGADPSIRARALLHIGMCYEKMGTQEAVKAYQRLVNNFPTQKNEVAIARKRLSRLILLTENVGDIPLKPNFTKIQMPGNPGNGVLSPEGKRIAFISEGDVWIVPVSGRVNPYIAGEPKRVTENIGAWDMSNSFSWSGDGKWIVFNQDPAPDSPGTDIYVIPSEGGDPKKVQVPSHLCGWPSEHRVSLSPDGKILAYASGWNDYSTFSTQIFTTPVSGGDTKVLTEPGTMEPTWSPNGSKIAYVKRSGDYGNIYSELLVIPAKGGTPTVVIDRQPGQILGPVWSPSGEMIAFLTSSRPHREYPKEIWIVSVTKEGNPSGAPRKINLPQASVHAIAGWTTDNKIGIQLMNQEYETIYTVPAGGGIATQVTPQGWTSYPKYSPDGKRIYFRWDGGKIASVPAGGGPVDSIDIDSEFDMITAVPGSSNEISPDGKTIVFSGGKFFYENNERQWEVDIFTVPVEGGKPKQLTEISVELQDRFPCWSPDGQSIAFIRPEIVEDKFFMHIYTMSGNGENQNRITERSDEVAWAPIDWTPDGKSITFFTNKNSIRSIPVEGGESTLITKIDSVNSQFELAWSPDGKELAYTDKGKIWIFTPGSGITREVKTGVTAHATKIGWSPEGKKIAFTAYSGGDSELWVMEHFLPLEKLQQIQEPEIADEPEGIRIRQIKKHAYLDDPGTVSADGRSLAYVFWGEGDVAIHDLIAGEDHVLTHEADLGESTHFAQSPVISRDGSRIAYYWWNPGHTFDLRMVDVGNPSSRILYKEDGIEVYPVTWISDQELIAIRQNRNTEKTQITLFNISDGTHRDLKHFDGRRWFHLSSSPDGKYVAYDHVEEPLDGNPDIHVLPVNGGVEVPLVAHPAKDHVLGWMPGKDMFLFTSDRSGTWDLWAVPVEEGKPSGPEKRIYTNIGDVSPMGFTDNGDCYVGFTRRNFNAYLAPFNPETGEIDPGSGTPMSGSNFCLEWSPDGQSLVYVKESPYSLDLTVRDLKTGVERQLADNLQFCEFPRWSPDGKSILLFGFEKEKFHTKGYRGGVFMVDAETGETKQVFLLSDYTYNPADDDRVPLSILEWAPDGKSFYYLFFTDRLVKHDLETGKDRVLFEHTGFKPYALDLSPDGNSLLFGLEFPGEEKGCLYVIPAEGGKEKEVCTFQEANHFETASWSPDGKYIYFVERPEETNLWRVQADGGEPVIVWSSEHRVEIFDIHPDGNQVAFSIRERSTEVRVIENLPAELEKIYHTDE
jgi:Tol biopolymer transport system component